VTIIASATVRQVIMGVQQTVQTRIDSLGNSTSHDFIVNGATTLNVAVAGLQNDTLYMGAMTSLGTTGYAKGNSEGNTVAVATQLSTGNFFVGAKQGFDTNPSEPVDGTLSSYMMGAGEGFDHTSFNDNLAILDTALAAV